MRNSSERSELIDTLWNVNEFFYQTSVHCITELIDTLWNVNLSSCQINHN